MQTLNLKLDVVRGRDNVTENLLNGGVVKNAGSAREHGTALRPHDDSRSLSSRHLHGLSKREYRCICVYFVAVHVITQGRSILHVASELKFQPATPTNTTS